MKSGFNLLTLLLCLLALASCGEHTNEENAAGTTANGAAATGSGQQQTTTAGKREGNFIDDVMELNNEEVAWLHAAVNNGTDASIKAYAQQALPDHQQVNTQLKEYASKHNIELDDDDTTIIVLDIDEDNGKDWDKEWADEMADKHRKILKKFERAQNRINDAELKGIVDNALPKLRSHLDDIRKLEVQLNKGGGK